MFEPENQLEESLIRAARDPAHRPQFYRDLLGSDIYAITDEPASTDSQESDAHEDRQITLQHWMGGDTSWLPIFSSLKRLQEAVQTQAGYIQINAKDFFKITSGENVVLNPNLDYGKEFTPEEIADLLDGSLFDLAVPYTIDANTEVLISQPAIFPEALSGALSRLFAANPHIQAAYLAQIHTPQDERPHLVIGIDVDAEGDWNKILGESTIVALSYIAEDDYADFIPIKDSDLGRLVIQHTHPFYTKPALH